MMVKLNILNMKEFLKVVNECAGPVMMIDSAGRKENIRAQDKIQQELRDRFLENKNSLPLCLDILNPKDYLKIVFYYAGEC